ncbi:MAG: 30S ribosomal protein S16 [Candidatus Saccharimonadales bacterium]
MLAIRMQRTGRKGHAMFRVIVQDSRRTPTSGKVVAQLGSYDPHAKVIILNKEKAAFYLEHGAQPSDRVARLLQAEDVKLPDWVKTQANKERTVRNADKRRSTRPAEEIVADEAPAEAPETASEPAAASEESPETVTPSAANEEAASEAAPKVDDEQSAETKAPTDQPAAEATAEEQESVKLDDAAPAENKETADKPDEAAPDAKAK